MVKEEPPKPEQEPEPSKQEELKERFKKEREKLTPEQQQETKLGTESRFETPIFTGGSGVTPGSGGTIGQRQTARAKEVSVPRQEKTQAAIQAEVKARQEAAQARRERLLPQVEQTPAEKALALQVSRQEVKASSGFQTLVEQRLLEEQLKVTEPTEAQIFLAGGRLEATGVVSPFITREQIQEREQLLAPPGVKERLQAKQIQQTEQRVQEFEFPLLLEPELTTEAQRGIRQQLQAQDITQTISTDIPGKKIFIEPSLETEPPQLLVSGIGQILVEPVVDVTKFGFQLGKGIREFQEAGTELVEAKTEKEREQIRKRIAQTAKETFITKEALTTAAIGTILIVPKPIQQLAFTAFAGSEAIGFAKKPSFIRAGRLVALGALTAIPKVAKEFKIARQRFLQARFESKLAAADTTGRFLFEKQPLEPTIRREFIDPKTGQVAKQFGGFRLKGPLITEPLSVQPQTGRPIIVSQAQLQPTPLLITTEVSLPPFKIVQRQVGVSESFLIEEGPQAGIEIRQAPRKTTEIEFIEPKRVKQTKIPEFLFETRQKQRFFEVTEPGELQGLRIPTQRETKFIQFKPPKGVGPSKPLKVKPSFQQSLGLFTGEIIPLGFEGTGFTRTVVLSRTGLVAATPFQRARTQFDLTKGDVKPKVIEPDEIPTDNLFLKLKEPKGLTKADVFAGDVVFKQGQGIGTPFQGQASDVVPPDIIIEVPRGKGLPDEPLLSGLGGTFFKGEVGDTFGIDFGEKSFEREKFKAGFKDILIPTIKPDIRIGGKQDIFIDTKERQRQIDRDITKQPESTILNIGIIDIGIPKQDQPQDERIGAIVIPRIDIGLIGDTIIPEPPKPKPPEKEPEEEKPIIDLPEFGEEPKKIKKQTGFNSLVKVKGKFQKLNKEPLPINRATNLALNFADSTPSVTAKVVRAKGPTKLPFDSFKNPTLLSKFQIRKDREGKGNVFVEKNKFRLDSAGELRGIQKKGVQARKGFGGFI